MRFIWLLFFITLLFSCTKKESSTSIAINDFSKHYRIDAKYDREHSVLRIEVMLDKVIHAYADGEKIGRPVKLLVNEQNGWRALGAPTMPHGTHKKLPGLGDSVILEGAFVITQKLSEGRGGGTARLMLQVCSDFSCDQPREHKIVFGY